MDTLSYRTVYANKNTVNKEWLVIDADSQVVGRLASEVAKRIRGKHKPNFTPNVDCGDNVIVVNSDRVRFTGNKWKEKIYQTYSGYPGGRKERTAEQVKQKSSIKIIEHAVRGMLPKNRLGRALFNNLFVYEGAEHPHEAQKPAEIKL